MTTVKLNKDSVPGLYSNGKTSILVMPSTQQNGYVIVQGTARPKVTSVSSVSGEYSFKKTFTQTKLDIV